MSHYKTMPYKPVYVQGYGVKDVIKKADKILKETKILSKNLAKINPVLGSAASLAGYGKPKLGLGKKKRRKSSRKPKQAGSFFGDILGKIASIPAGGIIGATAGLQNSLSGLGKPKRAKGRKKGAGKKTAKKTRMIIN